MSTQQEINLYVYFEAIYRTQLGSVTRQILTVAHYNV